MEEKEEQRTPYENSLDIKECEQLEDDLKKEILKVKEASDERSIQISLQIMQEKVGEPTRIYMCSLCSLITTMECKLITAMLL